MLEFMNMKCKSCGYCVDGSKEEFEARGGLCEGCFEEAQKE